MERTAETVSGPNGRRSAESQLWGRWHSTTFPKEHGKHLRTNNIIESRSPQVAVAAHDARQTGQDNGERDSEVLAVVCSSREKRFRKIDAPRLASEHPRGRVFEDGVQVTKQIMGRR